MYIELVLLPVLSLLHTSFHIPVSCNKVIKVKFLDRLKTRIIKILLILFLSQNVFKFCRSSFILRNQAVLMIVVK